MMRCNYRIRRCCCVLSVAWLLFGRRAAFGDLLQKFDAEYPKAAAQLEDEYSQVKIEAKESRTNADGRAMTKSCGW
jgi:hypothetical protein